MKRVAALLMVALVAHAGEKALGTTTASSGSINNQNTAVPFSIENGTLLSVQCDTPARIGVGVSTCTAATCPTAITNASDLFPTSCSYPLTVPYNGTYRKCLVASAALDGGSSSCNWFQRYGNEGASRGRTGGGSGSVVAFSGGYLPPTGQTVATITSAPLVLFVNGAWGSDANACTGSGDAGCATIQGAINKLPLVIHDPVTISVAPYDAGYKGFILGGNLMMPPGDGGTATLHIYGEQLVTASGLTGSTVGTSDGGTNSAGIGTWCALSTDGTLSASQLKGYLLELTGGPGAGTVRPIYDNDTTSILLTGNCSAVPTSATTYAVRDPVLVTTAVTIPSTLDAGSSTTGFELVGSWAPIRSNAIQMRVTNVGSVVASSTGASVLGPGRVAFQNSRLVGTSGLAVGDNAWLNFTNVAAIGTAGGGVAVQISNGGPGVMGLTTSYLRGTSAGASLGNLYGGSMTNTVIEATSSAATAVSTNNAGGMQNTTTMARCTGGGASTGWDLSLTSAGYGAAGLYLNHGAIDGCATGFKLNGPHHLYISGAIDLFGSITTLFSISHNAIVRQVSALSTSGYTTFLNLDGTTYAASTDVPGSRVMSSYGAVFDGVP